MSRRRQYTSDYWSCDRRPELEAKQQPAAAAASSSSSSSALSSSCSLSPSFPSPSLFTAPLPPTAVRKRDSFIVRKPSAAAAAASTTAATSIPSESPLLPPLPAPQPPPPPPPPRPQQPLLLPSPVKSFVLMPTAQYMQQFPHSRQQQQETNSNCNSNIITSPTPLPPQPPFGVKYVANPPTLSSVLLSTPSAKQPFNSTQVTKPPTAVTIAPPRSNFIPAAQQNIKSNSTMSAPPHIVPASAPSTAPTTASSTFAAQTNSSSSPFSSSSIKQKQPQGPPLAAIRSQAKVKEEGEEVELIERRQPIRATHLSSNNVKLHSSAIVAKATTNVSSVRTSTPTSSSSRPTTYSSSNFNQQHRMRDASHNSFTTIKREEGKFGTVLPTPRHNNDPLLNPYMCKQEAAARASEATSSRSTSASSSKKQAKKEEVVEEDDHSATKFNNNEHSIHSFSRLLNPSMREELKNIPYNKCKVKKQKDVNSREEEDQQLSPHVTFIEPPLPRISSPDPLTEVTCKSSIEPESQKLREMRAHAREVNLWKLEDTEKEQKECTTLLREITAGKKLYIPKGWKVLVADVVVIGAGAAGMKCVETLTKRSKELHPSSNTLEKDSNTTAALTSVTPQPPLRIIQLEGRSRIGGRIDTRRIQRLGEKPFCIERGAAFVHGCDPEGHNPAFNIALQYKLPCAYKNDAIDGWLSHGVTLPSVEIEKLREIYNDITEEDMMEYICEKMTTTKHEVLRLKGGGYETSGSDGEEMMSDVESKEGEEEAVQREYNLGSNHSDNESMHPFSFSYYNSPNASGAPSEYDVFSNYFDCNTPPSAVPAINPEFAEFAASLATLPMDESDNEHDVIDVASPERDSPPPLESPLFPSTPTVNEIASNNNDEREIIELLDDDEDDNIDSQDDCGECDDINTKVKIEKPNDTKSKKRKHRSHEIYVEDSAGITATRRLKTNRKSRRGLSPSTPASTSSASSSGSPQRHQHDRKRRRKHKKHKHSHDDKHQEENDSSDESDEDEDDADEDRESEDESMSDNDRTSKYNNRATTSDSDAESSDFDGEQMVLMPLKPAGDYDDAYEQRAEENRQRILKRKERMKKETQEKRLAEEKIEAKNRERREKEEEDRLLRKQKKDKEEARSREKRARIESQTWGEWKPEQDESHQSVYEKCAKDDRKEQDEKCEKEIRRKQDPKCVEDDGEEQEQEQKCEKELRKDQKEQPLSSNDLRLLESLHHSQHGYVAPLSKLSCFDGMQSAGFNGGERYLPNGYDEVIHILYHKALHRSKCENASCRYTLLLNHTVKCIEQPQYHDHSISSSSSTSNPCAIIHCPSNRTLIVTRFVVSTLSVGLMHSSIRYQDEMEAKYGKMLQVNLRGLKMKKEEGKMKDDVEMNGGSNTIISTADASIQQHAAILFSPPLHHETSSEFLSLGMGLENKIILVYPVASRFFPNHMHMLRSVKYPSWRFYNMHSIAQGKDLAVLVAHRPPVERPSQQSSDGMNEEDASTNYLSSYDLETMSRSEVLQHVMKVLHDMFTPDKEEAKRREVKQDQKMLKKMKKMGVGDEEKEKKKIRVKKEEIEKDEECENEASFEEETIEEPILPPDSDEESEYPTFLPPVDNDSTLLHSQQQDAQIPPSEKSTKIEWIFEYPHDDHRWQSRPVVPPLMFEITRWSRDPYALGAYSYIPVGCHAQRSILHLHQFHPPRQTTSLCDLDSLMSDLINSSTAALPAETTQTEGVLLFAGEALAVLDKQQVHGAMESGEKAAGRIIERMRAERHKSNRPGQTRLIMMQNHE